MLRQLAIVGLASLICFAYPQSGDKTSLQLPINILGPHQYPSFRTISGLPGGGFGVRPDGSLGFDGAMTFSTPIGYGLSNGHIALSAANTSDYGFFRLPHIKGKSGIIDSSGKITGCVGVSLGRFGSLSGSAMVISSELDTAFSLQYQAPLIAKSIGLSAGVQDLAGKRGDRAGNVPGARNSQSFFASVTAQLRGGVYVSGGWGTRRFDKGFASISAPLGSRFKAVLEEDGLGVNEAVAWNPKAFESLRIRGGTTTTMMIGFVDSRYAFWSLNIGF